MTNNIDPFSRLSPELLGEIFTQCLPPDGEQVSHQKPPLLFLHVCRRWRDVVLSTPSLWQNIHIGRRSRGLDPIAVFDAFLKRSGDMPLTITFRSPSNRQERLACEEERLLINTVFDNFHRVVALNGHLSGSFPAILVERLTAPGADRHVQAPLLKRINITGFEFPSATTQQDFIDNVSNWIVAPNLQELNLNSSRTFLSMMSLSPPLTNSLRTLKGLYISDLVQNTDMSFLCRVPNLATLDMCIFETFQPFTLQIPPSVHLPGLRELNLTLVGTRFAYLLQHFHVPNIETLAISIRAGPPFPEVMKLLMKRQIPPLRSLQLVGLDEVSDFDSALECFIHFTQVEQMVFRPFSTKLWKDATTQLLLQKVQKEGHDESKYEFFPELSSLTVKGAYLETAHCKPFVEFLRDRSTSTGGKLSYTKFLNCTFSDEKEFMRILHIETDGRLKVDTVVEDKCKSTTRTANFAINSS